MTKISIKDKTNTLLLTLLIALGAFSATVITSTFVDKREGTFFILMKNDALLENVITTMKADLNDKGLFDEISKQYATIKTNYTTIIEGGEILYGKKTIGIKPIKNKKIISSLKEQLKNISAQINFLNDSESGNDLAQSVEAYILNKNRYIRDKNNELISRLEQNRNQTFLIYTLIDFVLVLIFFAIFIALYKNLKNNLFTKLRETSENIPKYLSGDTKKLITPHGNDPLFKEILESVEMVGENVKYATEFAKQIGEGNFEYTLEISDKNDSLGLALEDMRSKLKSYSEQEAKRIWSTEGIAKFAQIVRENSDDISELSKTIISSIVKYIDANQGGLYITGEDDKGEPYLELKGFYAFEKHRYSNQVVYSDDNLLGRVLLDKDTIRITDIPPSYANISSGIGQSSPKTVIIIPLKVNDELHGAIEIASFNDLEDHKITFVENIAESIAASISTVKMNTNTKKLLDESQQLTLQLTKKEDEMTKSMQQLQDAQDEMQRNQVELNGVFSSINQTLATVEFSTDGRILKANNNSTVLLGYNLEELIGKYHNLFLKEEDSSLDSYNKFWEDLRSNISASGDFNWVCKGNKEIWINATFTPVQDTDGSVFKVIMLAKDITDEKKEELEFKKLSIVTNNTDNSVIITSKEGYIEYVNPGFSKLTGFQKDEVLGKKPEDVLYGADTNPETIESIEKRLKQNAPFYEEILNYTKTGVPYWISLAVNPVFNEDKVIDKYVYVQTNITDTKSRAIDFSSKLDAISKSNVMMELNLEGKILEMNENALKAFGFSEDEIIQKEHALTLSDEYKTSDDYNSFWKKLKSGGFIKGEFERIGKYSKTVWLRGIYSFVFDVNGKPFKIVFFGVDITEERKLREAALKKELELRENAKAINVTVASIEYSMEGKINHVNDIFLGVTGYQKEELIDQSYETILPPYEKGKPQHELMWENLRGGKFFSGEFKIMSKSGKDLYLNSTYNPILDDDGKPKKVMMFAQFTTDEKAKEVDLTGTVKALKSSLPVFELKPEGGVKTANNLFMNKYGYKRLQLRKLDLKAIFPKISPTETESLLKEFHINESFERTMIIADSEGKESTNRVTFTPIKNLESQIDKIVCIVI